jgi:suppressor of G2 allele of SKP1
MMSFNPIRHEWYQTDTHVIISLFCKYSKQVSVDFKPNSVDVDVDGNSLSFNNLFAAIDVDQSVHKVFSTKIEIKLLKEIAARWDDLERKQVVKTLEYPSSAKTKKDWSKEIQPEEDKVEGISVS